MACSGRVIPEDSSKLCLMYNFESVSLDLVEVQNIYQQTGGTHSLVCLNFI